MLMPERYAEDTGLQCAMVTRYRQVMVWKTTQKLNNGTANVSAFTPDNINGNGVRVQSVFWGGSAVTVLGPVTAGQQVEVTLTITNQGFPPRLTLSQGGYVMSDMVLPPVVAHSP